MAERDPEMCNCFLDEAKELLENAEQCFLGLEKAQDDPGIMAQILRLAHNLKGSAGAVGFDELSSFTHKLETVLIRLKNGDCRIEAQMVSLLLECGDFLKTSIGSLRQDLNSSIGGQELASRLEMIFGCGMCRQENAVPGTVTGTGACGFIHRGCQAGDCAPDIFEPLVDVARSSFTDALVVPRPAVQNKPAVQADDSIRVALGRIDKLMNNVGELVILQTGLSQTRHLLQSTAQLETVNQMDKIIRDIQEITMSLRMVPLAQTFQKMQRIVRDTAQSLSKDVELNISGEDIELDKNVLEQLSDPLVHLLRNAVDHGLETTEQRVSEGKPPKGNVMLAAYHSGGRVVIEVKDDGKGLNPKHLIAIAREKGILRPDDQLTDQQAYQLIFAPGFSTKEVVTNTSGRGVGMDVVKTNITALQGEVAIETVLGKGTTFRITLPLTLAIVDAMVVRVGGERYVVPIVQVSETIQIEQNQIAKVGETAQLLMLRSENIPICGLTQILGLGGGAARPWDSVGIVVRDTMQNTSCILVDQVLGQQQVVIKRLGNEVHWLTGVMGAAILGDGEAVLILDIHELLRGRSKSKNANSRNQTIQKPNLTKEAV